MIIPLFFRKINVLKDIEILVYTYTWYIRIPLITHIHSTIVLLWGQEHRFVFHIDQPLV